MPAYSEEKNAWRAPLDILMLFEMSRDSRRQLVAACDSNRQMVVTVKRWHHGVFVERLMLLSEGDSSWHLLIDEYCKDLGETNIVLVTFIYHDDT